MKDTPQRLIYNNMEDQKDKNKEIIYRNTEDDTVYSVITKEDDIKEEVSDTQEVKYKK